MNKRLHRILALRSRISTQLYAGIGGAVLLTLAASVVGWFSFTRVGETQALVNDESVPELVAAFGVAESGSKLVNGGPRLTLASSSSELEAVYEEMEETILRVEYNLILLEGYHKDDPILDRISTDADNVISNIRSIRSEGLEGFNLAESRALREAELTDLRIQLNDVLIPALDDQFFFTVTGRRELSETPAPPSEHLSSEQLINYRILTELQADASNLTSIFANVFTLSDASYLEPLRERFESSASRVQRNLTSLRGTDLYESAIEVFTSLLDLGSGENDIFNLFASELAIAERQAALLAENRNLAEDLLTDVNVVATNAETNATQATRAADDAILLGRTLLLLISGLSILGALLIIWFFIGRYLLRRLIMLSDWMRQMSRGDLEAQVTIEGRDEIADMAATLEMFRRHALEVQRLNLVEELADELQEKNAELESVLDELRKAQDQIVVREKLAALGELTAGVAHEIKNPLNFVKNFSEASQELIVELKEILDDVGEDISDDDKEYINEIAADLTGNVERIRSHSNRADRIVRDMLMMGRDSGDWQRTDLNTLIKQHAQLSFHSARALDSDFQLDIQEDLDPNMDELEVIPQDLGRVFLNMVTNAGHATNDRRVAEAESGDQSYSPTVWITTRQMEDQIEVRIKDNGTGMPPEVVEKIFNPFFTTKPTNQGTGLGLSISSDIVRRHGGTIKVDTKPNEYTEMIVSIPLQRPPDAG